MIIIHILSTLYHLLVIGVLVYGAYDISADVKAFIASQKVNEFPAPDFHDSVEAVVTDLLDHAPDNPEQPYSWAGYEGTPTWFSENGMIKAMYLKETSTTLVCRIERGTTLTDFVTFVFNSVTKSVDSVEVATFWHGRQVPFMRRRIELSEEETPYGNLFKKGRDADFIAIARLRKFYKEYNYNPHHATV